MTPGSCSLVVLLCQLLSLSGAQYQTGEIKQWSEWSVWSPCSLTCGSGIETRTRRCQRGLTGGGIGFSGRSDGCDGESSQIRVCKIEACPKDVPTTHEAACSRYNSRVFSGRRYVWEPFTHPPSPCKMACRAKGQRFYANLAGRHDDGTPCGKGTAEAICVSGACRRIGCDGVVASTAARDSCGVCQGDGSSCSTITGIFTSSKLRRGLNDVITIPVGSTNINITELEPSRNLLLLQTVEGKTILTGGSRSPVSGQVAEAGTVFTYSPKNRRYARESISAPGPINVGIKLKLLLRGRNPGIQYSFNVPRNQGEAFLRQINGPSQPGSDGSNQDTLRDRLGVSSFGSGQDRQKQDKVLTTPPHTSRTSFVKENDGRTTTRDPLTDGLSLSEDIDSEESDESSSEEESMAESSAESSDMDDDSSDLNSSESDEDEEDDSAYDDDDYDDDDDDSEIVDDNDDDDEEDDDYDDDDDYDSGSNDESDYDDDDEDEGEVGMEHDTQNASNEDRETGEEADEYQEGDKRVRGDITDSIGVTDSSAGKAHSENEMREDEDKRRQSVYSSTRRTYPTSTDGFKIPKYSQSFPFGERYKYSNRNNSSRQSTRSRTRRPQIQTSTRRSNRVISYGLQYVDSKNQGRNGQEQFITTDGRRYSPKSSTPRYVYTTTARGRSGVPSNRIEGRDVRTTGRPVQTGARQKNDKTTQTNRNNWRNEDIEKERLRRQRLYEEAVEARRRQIEEERRRYNQRLKEYQERVRRRNAEIAARREARRRERERYELERERARLEARRHGGNAYGSTRVIVHTQRPTIRRSSTDPSKSHPQTQQEQTTASSKGPIVRPYGEDGLYASTESSEVSSTASSEETFSTVVDSPSSVGREEVLVDRQTARDNGHAESTSHLTIADETTETTIEPQVPDTQRQPDITSRVDRPRSQTQPDIISRVARPGSKAQPRIISRVSNPGSQPGSDIISRVSRPGTKSRPDIISRVAQAGSQQPQPDIIPRVRSPGQWDRSGGRRPSLVSSFSGADSSTQISINNVIPDSDPSTQLRPRPDRPGPSFSRQPVDNTIDPGSNAGDAAYAWRISGLTDCTRSCGGGVQQTVVVCVDTTTQAVVTDENCRFIQRPDLTAVKCNTRPCPAVWTPGPWSHCSATCGRGQRTRTIACLARVSPTLNLTMDNSSCEGKARPAEVEDCDLDPCNQWRAGNWSQCSARCGDGIRTRPVQCVSLSGDVVSDETCTGPKPNDQLACDKGPCGKGWFYQEWPDECPVECGEGEVTRKIFCSGDSNEILPEERCDPEQRPETTRKCRSDRPCGGQWFTGPWSKCDALCGQGQSIRDVICIKTLAGGIFAPVDEENCLLSGKPADSEPCEVKACLPEWYMTSWSQCSKTCDTGHRSREVKCLSPEQTPSDQCPLEARPKTRDSCNKQRCKPKAAKETKDVRVPSGCVDHYPGCRVVKKARLCRYEFYKRKCCKSCL
ncbi:A disintegrin and metalloproteinase with thrombospondin motifs 16 [Plakobranchus ocellatus]|uniref:A disintegrin and metalloproteinase with thrombospondin motifs 16 n=1 Tax=Plakobranchus ocellatus TaxID=259542 RepID=A0AAV4DUM6_9GAST|nr:A disintegrin and metalloproteinase with thrombospondin motifs 16 [Plakobranchus ocellatus]